MKLKLVESIEVACTSEHAFDCTQDYSKRLTWDTFLAKADLINGASEAELGVRSYCEAQNGVGMETEYVAFNRPKSVAVKMTAGPFMFDHFAGSWRFSEKEGKTTITFTYSFGLRFPHQLLKRYIYRRLQSEVKVRLEDLKRFLEH